MLAVGAGGEVAPGELGLTLGLPQNLWPSSALSFQGCFLLLRGSAAASGFPLPPISLARLILALAPSICPSYSQGSLVGYLFNPGLVHFYPVF